MRLRNNPNALKILNDSKYIINQFPYEIKENTILEIGMGKGTMITNMAFDNPNTNYIGLEKFATPALKALKKATNLDLNNFKILIGDANDLLNYFTNKFDSIWITFSDPWPKKRHYKRRLVYRDFLKIYREILKPNSNIYFKSDNDDLYNFAIEELKYINANIIYTTNDLENSKQQYIKNYFTDYEVKFKEKNKTINFIVFNFSKNDSEI